MAKLRVDGVQVCTVSTQNRTEAETVTGQWEELGHRVQAHNKAILEGKKNGPFQFLCVSSKGKIGIHSEGDVPKTYWTESTHRRFRLHAKIEKLTGVAQELVGIVRSCTQSSGVAMTEAIRNQLEADLVAVEANIRNYPNSSKNPKVGVGN